MIVSIHQPSFLPWPGYFYKIAKSDIFVTLDTVQYSKHAFFNRNKIKTPEGELWLTVPVEKASGLTSTLMKDVRISNQHDWKRKHLRTFEMNYKRAKYFDEIYRRLEKVYNEVEWDNLCLFNMALMRTLLGALRLNNCRLVKASDICIDIVTVGGTHLLIGIVKRMEGKTYLSGFGGKKYQAEDMYKEAGIELQYYEFSPPTYPQLWGEFIPRLSIIDLLFNCGPDSLDILLNKKEEQE